LEETAPQQAPNELNGNGPGAVFQPLNEHLAFAEEV
jgi:hypothetical protein